MEYCCQHGAVARLPWGRLCFWGLGCAGDQGALSPRLLENFGVSVIVSSTSPAPNTSPTTSEGRVEGWETPSTSNKPEQHLGELHLHPPGSGGPALCGPRAATPKGQCQRGGDTAGAGHHLQSCAVPRALGWADNIQIPVSKTRPRAQPCPGWRMGAALESQALGMWSGRFWWSQG